MASDELQFKGEKIDVDFDLAGFFFKFRWPIAFLLLGLILIGAGLFLTKGSISSSPKVEVLQSSTEANENISELVVEVVGAVEKPGVYKLPLGSRVEDALILAGGISADADRDWMEKVLNRAAKLVDGQKIYVPKQSEETSAKNVGDIKIYQSENEGQGSGLININRATTSELESLWGIGPKTAENIIEQRPYSSVEDLLTKKILKKNVYERNKDLLTVY